MSTWYGCCPCLRRALVTQKCLLPKFVSLSLSLSLYHQTTSTQRPERPQKTNTPPDQEAGERLKMLMVLCASTSTRSLDLRMKKKTTQSNRRRSHCSRHLRQPLPRLALPSVGTKQPTKARACTAQRLTNAQPEGRERHRTLQQPGGRTASNSHRFL
jgi:hypothetical protein